MIGIDSWWCSGAQRQHRREFARQWKENGILGSAGFVGGGGDTLSLPGLGGAFRWIAGGLVKVKRGLNWAERGYAGSLRIGLILDRNGCRCLLWRFWTVVGLKAK